MVDLRPRSAAIGRVVELRRSLVQNLSIQSLESASSRLNCSSEYGFANLDDGNDVGRGVVQFAHVDHEMLQLISFRLLEDDSASFSYCLNAPEICHRIGLRIWRSGNGDLR